MFKDNAMFSSFAVDDTESARAFYGRTLGLDVHDADEAGLLQIDGAGGHRVIIYPSPNHKPAGYTVLNIVVDDIDAAVDALAAAGVTMEHYDTESIKTGAKGIARGDSGPAIAWFRDPAGNILSVLQPRG